MRRNAVNCKRDTRTGVYEYTKASSPAISKIANAIAPLTSLTGAIMEAHGPPLLSTMDSTFLACHDRLKPYVIPYVAPLVRHGSVVAETKVVKPFLRVLNAAEDSIAYYLPETTSELESARVETASKPAGEASEGSVGIQRRSARLVCAVSTVLKRRALACLQAGSSAPAGLVATTTYLTGSTLTYCCNAWIEPTLRLCKNGTLSLLASFGDLEVTRLALHASRPPNASLRLFCQCALALRAHLACRGSSGYSHESSALHRVCTAEY